MPESRECRSCGSSLAVTGRSGRPREYCSDACRRLAEADLRRLRRLVDKADDELAQARADVAGCRGMAAAITGRRRVEFWADELDSRLGDLRAMTT